MELVTFIHHESALLCAISMLIGNILILFHVFYIAWPFVLVPFVEFTVSKTLKCTLYPFKLSI